MKPAVHLFPLLTGLAWMFLPLAAADLPDATQVRRWFSKPPREYATAPLWVWNDQLTDSQVVGTLRDLAAQEVRQVFVHPRPGLMTPYLSEEWFRLWRLALREAERLDLSVWIYDENSYPSGFAGGWVPELMPESRGRGLHLIQVEAPPAASPDVLALFHLGGRQPAEVTDRWRAGEALPTGHPYLTATVVRASNSPWHGNRSYVDLLHPGVTAKFLEVTLEPYRLRFGREFGRRIPGVFTDEPELRPAGGLPWTDDLPAVYAKRWGYGLISNSPSLTLPAGDWRRVRHNYYQTLNDLFIERWARPYHDYCASNNLEFTGHYWDHEWPDCGTVPDNMAMYAWHQRPAIDCLMNQYREDTHAQFGNVRMVRELASVANQLGRKRTLCELYGAGGWDLRFEDMKRIADWLGVLGVNTFDEHLSYITLRGARKRDHPQSFSYHEPWWEAYHVTASYLTRLSVALSQGEQRNRVLVLEPTTTAWMLQGTPELKHLGDSFFNLLMSLEAAQVEYDLGCEDIMAREGRVEAGSGFGRPVLRVGRAAYEAVVLPPHTANLNRSTWRLLRDFLRDGGEVLACGTGSMRIDGAELAELEFGALRWNPRWKLVEAGAVAEALAGVVYPDGFQITRMRGDRGVLFHQRRRLKDGQMLFLVNTSLDQPSTGSIEARAGGVEEWDLASGRTWPIPCEREKGIARIDFDLPPVGSRLLFLPDRPQPDVPAVAATNDRLPALGPMQVRRLQPNVLTLDYVDVAAAGQRLTNAYFYPAAQLVFRANGLERNPWDSAVQFKDELIRRTFPPESGFEAAYRFVVEGDVPENLAIVIERPDLYAIHCNGKPVRPARDAWWLDRAFGRIDLARVATKGENVVTVKAAPFTLFHELEPAYLLGDFTLRAVERGFVVTADRPLLPGPWNSQGLPFYANGVAYRLDYRVGSAKGRFVVALGKWHGSVAKVIVNGRSAGYIGWPPWECDVSRWIRRGGNSIEVVVIGSLKNTLGPHHGNPGRGSAWPGMFQKGPANGPPPGAEYDTIGYGLFEPFALKSVK